MIAWHNKEIAIKTAQLLTNNGFKFKLDGNNLICFESAEHEKKARNLIKKYIKINGGL